MRHAILGPGGIGGLVGALLAHSGEAVGLIVRPESADRYPHELVVKSPSRVISGPVSVGATLSEPVDILWVTVKATDLRPALEGIPPTAEVGVVVPLLNGIDHIPVLRKRFGHKKVVPATIAVESEKMGPSQIVWRSPFARLNLFSAGQDRLASAVEKLAAFGWECRFLDDENTLLWSKLVFLAPLALCTTAAGASAGQIMTDASHNLELRAVATEACSVGVASGASVRLEQVLNLFSKLPPGMRSSMQKDVESGRPPELDAIAGPIIRGGNDFGIPVTTTARLVEQIEGQIKRGLASQPPVERI